MAEKPIWISWSSEFLNGIPAQPEVHDLRGFEEVFGSYPQAVRTTGWQGTFFEASRGVELKCLKLKFGAMQEGEIFYGPKDRCGYGFVVYSSLYPQTDG